jgi:hypothetical protein
VSDQMQLSQLLHRESRSFLQYVRESFPWAGVKSESARVAVQRMADAEAAALAKLARLTLKKHLTLPTLGDFPISFTESNYVSVSYLIPKLASIERKALADLERDLISIGDPDLRVGVESLLDLKRANLAELERLIPEKAA